MSYKNYNFEIIERIRREIDLENGKILINIVVFTKHVTRSVVYICRSKKGLLLPVCEQCLNESNKYKTRQKKISRMSREYECSW